MNCLDPQSPLSTEDAAVNALLALRTSPHDEVTLSFGAWSSRHPMSIVVGREEFANLNPIVMLLKCKAAGIHIVLPNLE